MKTFVQRARATAKTSGEKTAGIASSATQKTSSKSAPKIAASKAVAPKAAELKSAKPRSAKPKTVSGKTASPKATSAAAHQSKAEKSVVSGNPTSGNPTSGNPTSETPALRATKKRAPKDLATQYGESVKTPRAVAPKAAPRKRRNAQSRAKLQAVIAPDDGLMQRLARAGAISSSQMAESSASVSSKPLSTRRSRKWETLCGKCGVSAQYSSSAALCVKCGAILVRD